MGNYPNRATFFVILSLNNIAISIMYNLLLTVTIKKVVIVILVSSFFENLLYRLDCYYCMSIFIKWLFMRERLGWGIDKHFYNPQINLIITGL